MKKIVKRIVNTSLFLIGASIIFAFSSCKQGQNSTEQPKTFEVSLFQIWAVDALSKKSINISGESKEHNLKLTVDNCQTYKAIINIDGNISTIEGKQSVAIIENLEIPILTASIPASLTITGDGMREFTQVFSIKYTHIKPEVKVFVTLGENEEPIEVFDGDKRKTEKNKILVTLESRSEISEAKIAGSVVNLTDKNKKASKEVDAGRISINLEFKYQESFTASFDIEKVNQGNRTIDPIEIILCTGEDYTNKHVLKQNKDGIYTCEPLSDIQYSTVKLEMRMDSELVDAKLVNCEDERSDGYEELKTSAVEMIGVFSGRLKEEISENGASTIFDHPFKKNEYIQYLIAGAGKVCYTFDFKATGRKDTTHKIEIQNKSKRVLEAETGATYENIYSQHQIDLNRQVFQWIGYREEPINISNNKQWYEVNKNIEYMGDLAGMYFTFPSNQVSNSIVYFYYHLFDDRKLEKVHEFVRIAGSTSPAKNFQLLPAYFNPMEKHVDAFVATKHMLPIFILPISLQKPWKKIVKKGFTLQLFNENTINENGKMPNFAEFIHVFSYRNLAKIYEENNKSSNLQKSPVKIGKNQKYKLFIDGQEKEMSSYLQAGKKDLFVMQPTFLSNKFETLSAHFNEIKYSIKKGKDKKDTEWENVDGYQDIPVNISKLAAIPLGTKADSFNSNDEIIPEKKFEFIDGEVYRIEVETTLKDNTKEYFDYQIYYTDDWQIMNNY